MIRIVKILLLVSLISFLKAWHPAKNISTYRSSHHFDYSLYTDSSTGISHVGYCNISDRAVYYLQISKNGDVGPKSIVSTGQPCYNGVDVAGAHDGSTVFLAYYALRLSWTYDTYFVETNNGGKTWSKPEQVPRKDLNDWPNRMWPQFLVNTFTKRLFLFYNYEGPLGSHVVMFTGKPIGSSVLTPEQMVVGNAYFDLARPILTADPQNTKDSKVHLYWSHVMNGNKYVSYSDNNGLTWSEPKNITRTICSMTPQSDIFKIVSDQTIDPSMLIAVCGSLREDYYLKVSYDQGATWEKDAITLPTNFTKDWTICKDSHGKSNFVVHYNDKNGNQKLREVRIRDKTSADLDYPNEATIMFSRSSLTCLDKTKARLRMMLEELKADVWVQRVYDS